MEKKSSTPVAYNRCKTWQMGFFVLNNTATNFYMVLMNYVNYYAVGIAGLLTGVVGIVLTSMRIFDGITDPIIGYIIDKTNGKFGKFRPFMILGNAILAVSTLLIYETTHLVPQSFRLIYFILLYAIYIIGYTFQTACTKAAQNCMTNDPKQRPLFTQFDSVYNTILFTGMNLLVSNVLIKTFGSFANIQVFNWLVGMVIVASAVCTLLAVIGVSPKDRIEFFGTGKVTKVKFSEYLDVIKHNRAIQMLVVAASSDKLSMNIAQNSVLATVLFGIMIGDYSLNGTMSLITLFPTLILTLILVNFSKKTGMKKAVVVSSVANIFVFLIFGCFIVFTDVTQISLTNFSLVPMLFTITYIVLYVIRSAISNVSGNLVIPMISDCADYETYRTGRYVPGMMGTLFSFVDKLISSLATSIVALYLAAIGYATTMPQPGDAVTTALKVFWFIMAIGFPVFGLVCNLISMKFYPLDKAKMEEIQESIAEIKAKAMAEDAQ